MSEPINMKVVFGRERAFLETVNSVELTSGGVKIWVKSRPGNNYQAMAEIPDGTLEKYKHCRPEIVSCEWKES